MKLKPQVSMISQEYFEKMVRNYWPHQKKLCNLSISSRTFPDASKIAKLKPLFEKGTRRDPKYYRPISLLSRISKVQKRVIDKLRNFLTNTKFCLSFNQGLGKTIQPIFVCLIWLTCIQAWTKNLKVNCK